MKYLEKRNCGAYLDQDYEIGRLNMSNHFVLYNYFIFWRDSVCKA